MTVICAWCAKEVGERCPNCGLPAFPMVFRARFLLIHFWRAVLLLGLRMIYGPLLTMPQVCTSMNCLQVMFLKGLGGVSHGCCEECRAKNRKQFPGGTFASSAGGVH